VDLLLPSYNGPVSMDGILSPNRMFSPSGKLAYERMQRENQNTPITPTRPAPPRPSLADGLRPFARRAVVVDARTADDVDSIVASMRKLGLNELWLEIFSPGIPEKSSPEALAGSDLLTEALKAAHGTGIHVMPVLRLLEWGPPVPASVRDLTILGEDAPATQKRTLTESTDSRPNPAASSAPAAVWVSPFDANVRKRLEQVVSKTAAQPGIAGMVWRKMSPPGYNSLDDDIYTGKLGYTTAGRLAFLLSKHADPVDIDPVPGREMETSLPGFDNAAIDNTLRSEWLQFRVDEDLSLLRDLRQIAAKASAAPVLVEARQRDDGATRRNGWYGDWEGGGSPLPAERREPVGWAEMSVQAHAESRTALFCLAPQDLGGADVASVLGARTYGSHWDGVVLDLTTRPTGPGRGLDSAERLAALAR